MSSKIKDSYSKCKIIWWGVVVVGSNPTFRSTIGSSSVVEHYKLLYIKSLAIGRVAEPGLLQQS